MKKIPLQKTLFLFVSLSLVPLNSLAYNTTQKKLSDPRGPLWINIMDGSIKAFGTCASQQDCHTKRSNGKLGIKRNNLLKANKIKFSHYLPGKIYSLTIALPKTKRGKINGFQMSDRGTDGKNAGKFKRGKNTQVYKSRDVEANSDISLIEYMHLKKKVGSWKFQWTAPSSGKGPVTFYFSLVAGNLDGISTNDTVYYGKTVVIVSR